MGNGNTTVEFGTVLVNIPPNDQLSQTITVTSNPFRGPITDATAALSNWSLQYVDSDHSVQSMQMGISNIQINPSPQNTVTVSLTAGLQDDNHDKTWEGTATIVITALVGVS